jgi:hypothetical protein
MARNAAREDAIARISITDVRESIGITALARE